MGQAVLRHVQRRGVELHGSGYGFEKAVHGSCEIACDRVGYFFRARCRPGRALGFGDQQPA